MKWRIQGQDKLKIWMFKKLVINRKVGLFMLNFTWNVFSQTGNVDTYL
ncbi:YqzL family protein, partial [Klebsiella pneumoniae]|nr:YqzL family protein [Klebsiella pneumoniae]